jgi:membrane-bound ClpP family serine protease
MVFYKEAINMEHCTPQCMALKLLILGIILILVRVFTAWDIWVVLGVLLIIKAVILFLMPTCPCTKKHKRKR